MPFKVGKNPIPGMKHFEKMGTIAGKMESVNNF